MLCNTCSELMNILSKKIIPEVQQVLLILQYNMASILQHQL